MRRRRMWRRRSAGFRGASRNLQEVSILHPRQIRPIRAEPATHRCPDSIVFLIFSSVGVIFDVLYFWQKKVLAGPQVVRHLLTLSSQEERGPVPFCSFALKT